MAVVAALNGRAKESAREHTRDVPNTPVDVKAIERDFESLLVGYKILACIHQADRFRIRGMFHNKPGIK